MRPEYCVKDVPGIYLMVGARGFEPRTPALSAQCSALELCAREIIYTTKKNLCQKVSSEVNRNRSLFFSMRCEAVPDCKT